MRMGALEVCHQLSQILLLEIISHYTVPQKLSDCFPT